MVDELLLLYPWLDQVGSQSLAAWYALQATKYGALGAEAVRLATVLAVLQSNPNLMPTQESFKVETSDGSRQERTLTRRDLIKDYESQLKKIVDRNLIYSRGTTKILTVEVYP